MTADTDHARGARRQRWTWLALAAVVPAAVLFWLNACFVWNHFLTGPYLQDSGWCSSLVYHNDFFVKNPPAADWRPEYFGIHASLALSFASMISWAFPGDRIEWYCLFQGAIYAPLGALVALLVGRDAARPGARDALLVGACGLVFALNGQVLACMGYPHYEIIAPVGLCMMLAGLADGRTRLAWLGLAVAVGAREDGGLHAASFLGAVLACDYLKRPLPVPRRLVLTMAGAAVAASVLLIASQKLFFQHANYAAALQQGGHAVDGLDVFRHEYLGRPTFAHLDAAVLRHRVSELGSQAAFVLLPLLATVAIATAMRDGRYLLGWAVEIPWMVLNFVALQELKSRFAIYTGFPFVVSIFWVGVYTYAKSRSRTRTLALLTTVALSSTIGSAYSAPSSFVALFERAAAPLPIPSAGIRSFSRTLRENPDTYGPLFVDHEVASWTLEKLPIEARVRPAGFVHDGVPLTPGMIAQRDGIAFFKDGLMAPILVRFLMQSPFTHCGRIARTDVFFCTREGRPLPPEFTPSSLLVSRLRTQGTARREGETVIVGATESTGIQAFGANLQLPRGTYSARWSTRALACPGPSGSPRMRFDLAREGKEIVAADVLSADELPHLDFEVTDPDHTFELRAWSGGCTYAIDSITLSPR